MMKATSSHRDATMILLLGTGLEPPSWVDLRWEQADFDRGVLHVRRAKAARPRLTR